MGFQGRRLPRLVLMAVNEAGSLPPQESGLVNNGWNGKFHMEMYWWHAAHYALWAPDPRIFYDVNVAGTPYW